MEKTLEIVKKYRKNEQNQDAFEEIIDFLSDNYSYLDIAYNTDTNVTLACIINDLTAYNQDDGYINIDDFIQDSVIDNLHNCEYDELVYLNNDNLGIDNYIYDDLEQLLEGCDDCEIVKMTYRGNYQGGSIGYYQLDENGNIDEDYPENFIDIDELANAIIENNDITLTQEACHLLSQMTMELVKIGY